jgi:hypothetical protein
VPGSKELDATKIFQNASDALYTIFPTHHVQCQVNSLRKITSIQVQERILDAGSTAALRVGFLVKSDVSFGLHKFQKSRGLAILRSQMKLYLYLAVGQR